MLPFALGAVIGAVAVTAIAESRIGKAFSKKGAKIIDTLEDRVSSLAKTVVEDHDICEKLKSGYENVSSKVSELAEYCQSKGKEVVQKVKAEVKPEAKVEPKSTKPKAQPKTKEAEAKAAQAKSAKAKTTTAKKKK